MENFRGRGPGDTESQEPDDTENRGPNDTGSQEPDDTESRGPGGALTDEALAVGLVTRLERMVGLLRSLSQPDQLSMTSASTLAMLEREGPSRLTALSARQGVTQPAMTQLIGRLHDSGLVRRETDPADRRVVLVSITGEGKALLACRRERRAERLAALLGQLSPDNRAVLAAALPAMDALASARSHDDPVPAWGA
jgi:DNA-binding MarR family transcriptional regulator